MPDGGYTKLMFAMWIVTEKNCVSQKIYAPSIDLEKAHDTIDGSKLWCVQDLYDLKRHFLWAVGLIYYNCKVSATVN